MHGFGILNNALLFTPVLYENRQTVPIFEMEEGRMDGRAHTDHFRIKNTCFPSGNKDKLRFILHSKITTSVLRRPNI